MPSPLLTLTALTSVMLAAPTLAGDVLHVPGPLDLTIQEAIDIAESLGTTVIQVEPGIYRESIDFNGVVVELRGSPADPTQTIIDVSEEPAPVRAVQMISGEGAGTIIRGFTIRGGRADDGAIDRGAGVQIRNGAAPLIEDCILTENVATFGGAVYADQSAPTFRRCVFEENAAFRGGAMYANLNQGMITLEACRFERCQSDDTGTALHLFTSLAGVMIRDCDFFDCTTTGAAVTGAVHVVGGVGATMVNGVFAENDVAVHASSTASTTLMHCTIADDLGGAGAIDIRNSVVWGTINATGPLAITYTMTRDAHPGVGNIQPADAVFVDLTGRDLRLQSTSPGIDAGSTLASASYYPPYGTDRDGAPRAVDALNPDTGLALFGVTVDMGAFELPGPTGGPNPCPADTNMDGDVNFTDLLAVLSAWGVCP